MGSRLVATPRGVNPRWGTDPSLPLYILEVWAAQDTRVPLLLGAALPFSLLVSCGAWRSPAGVPRSSTTTTPSCCCWTESSPTSPSPLLDQEGGDVSPNHTCVERGGAVRSALGSPVIWITSSTTPSSPFFERFRTRSTRYVDASDHSLLDELIDGSW